MTSIIIYTTGDKLLHKQGKLPDDEDWAESGYYYWHLRGVPYFIGFYMGGRK